MKFPNIDPTILKIAGPFAIRWYAIPYILTALIARYAMIYTNKKKQFCSIDQINDICSSGLIGLVCGARLTYVIFYDPTYYVRYPMEVLMIWKGGMSFHGGLVGLATSVILYCKNKGINPARVLDSVAFVIPVGLFLGRLANFVNGELYGRPTSLAIGVIFPTDPYKISRHPSQLYEAGLEGLALGLIMATFFFKKSLFERFFYKDYHISALALTGYSFFRFFSEFFREPDGQIGLIFGIITMGQVLSIISISGVAFYIIRSNKHGKISNPDK
jgi:phosphatidylglycerol:prolipoprotein diacylglycerol transferase